MHLAKEAGLTRTGLASISRGCLAGEYRGLSKRARAGEGIWWTIRLASDDGAQGPPYLFIARTRRVGYHRDGRVPTNEGVDHVPDGGTGGGEMNGITFRAATQLPAYKKHSKDAHENTDEPRERAIAGPPACHQALQKGRW